MQLEPMLQPFFLAVAMMVSPATASPMQAEHATPAKSRPARKTAIAWLVTPGSVVVYLDGKKLGRAADLKLTPAKPGRHEIRLTKGGDETELEIDVMKGQVTKFVFDFAD